MSVTRDRMSSNGQFLAVLIAGMGGCLPTLCSLAAASSNHDSLDFLSAGHLMAMILYFLIGAILCFGVGEKRRREAFLLGIAAPAIIASFLNGSSNYRLSNSLESSKEKVGYFSPISSAYASPSGFEDFESEVPSQFLNDFRRGLGFNIDAEILHKKNNYLSEEVSSLTEQLSSIKSELKEYQLDCIKHEHNNSRHATSSELGISEPTELCSKCSQCPVIESEVVGNDEMKMKLIKIKHDIALMGLGHIYQYLSDDLKHLLYSHGEMDVIEQYYHSNIKGVSGDSLCESLPRSQHEYFKINHLELYNIAIKLPPDCHIKNNVGFQVFSFVYIQYAYGLNEVAN